MPEVVITLEDPTPESTAACEAILRRLPKWFGIEAGIVHYVEEVSKAPTLIARVGEEVAGFLLYLPKTEYSADIHVMGVDPDHQGCGVGTQMIAEAERRLREAGFEYLQVKTQGPSRECAFYERTRHFYHTVGFRALEEFQDLWPGTPCLVMVKKL